MFVHYFLINNKILYFGNGIRQVAEEWGGGCFIDSNLDLFN
jgi:hypothetical protein